MIVVDTTILASFYLENPHKQEIEALFVKDCQWLAPTMWRSEFRNLLASYMHQGTIRLDESLTIMTACEELMEKMEYKPTSSHVLTLVQVSGCSAYECEYVALARDFSTVLITLDWSLLKSFPRIALTPTAFLAL
jgi:predicted nucleic acid-binding protein